MQTNRYQEQMHLVGEELVLDSVSPMSGYAVVFEDDVETGYFYALDTSITGQPILDALHVYDVEQVIDRYKQSRIAIVWSADGLKAGLAINGQYHAVIDFSSKQGWCRSGGPPTEWSKKGHDWDDKVINLLQ